jgi:hypothetical protein
LLAGDCTTNIADGLSLFRVQFEQFEEGTLGNLQNLPITNRIKYHALFLKSWKVWRRAAARRTTKIPAATRDGV